MTSRQTWGKAKIGFWMDLDSEIATTVDSFLIARSAVDVMVTADIKGRRFVPLLEILSDLVEAGVSVRLIHAEEPGPRYREDFDNYA